jgi:hypothetical protein
MERVSLIVEWIRRLYEVEDIFLFSSQNSSGKNVAY